MLIKQIELKNISLKNKGKTVDKHNRNIENFIGTEEELYSYHESFSREHKEKILRRKMRFIFGTIFLVLIVLAGSAAYNNFFNIDSYDRRPLVYAKDSTIRYKNSDMRTSEIWSDFNIASSQISTYARQGTEEYSIIDTNNISKGITIFRNEGAQYLYYQDGKALYAKSLIGTQLKRIEDNATLLAANFSGDKILFYKISESPANSDKEQGEAQNASQNASQNVAQGEAQYEFYYNKYGSAPTKLNINTFSQSALIEQSASDINVGHPKVKYGFADDSKTFYINAPSGFYVGTGGADLRKVCNTDEETAVLFLNENQVVYYSEKNKGIFYSDKVTKKEIKGINFYDQNCVIPIYNKDTTGEFAFAVADCDLVADVEEAGSDKDTASGLPLYADTKGGYKQFDIYIGTNDSAKKLAESARGILNFNAVNLSFTYVVKDEVFIVEGDKGTSLGEYRSEGLRTVAQTSVLYDKPGETYSENFPKGLLPKIYFENTSPDVYGNKTEQSSLSYGRLNAWTDFSVQMDMSLSYIAYLDDVTVENKIVNKTGTTKPTIVDGTLKLKKKNDNEFVKIGTIDTDVVSFVLSAEGKRIMYLKRTGENKEKLTLMCKIIGDNSVVKIIDDISKVKKVRAGGNLETLAYIDSKNTLMAYLKDQINTLCDNVSDFKVNEFNTISYVIETAPEKNNLYSCKFGDTPKFIDENVSAILMN